MDFDNLGHRLFIWELDVVKETAAQEGVGQVFFIIGCDDDNWALLGRNRLACLVNRKAHFIQLMQEVIRELNICLIDFIDQQDGAYI